MAMVGNKPSCLSPDSLRNGGFGFGSDCFGNSGQMKGKEEVKIWKMYESLSVGWQAAILTLLHWSVAVGLLCGFLAVLSRNNVSY